MQGFSVWAEICLRLQPTKALTRVLSYRSEVTAKLVDSRAAERCWCHILTMGVICCFSPKDVHLKLKLTQEKVTHWGLALLTTTLNLKNNGFSWIIIKYNKIHWTLLSVAWFFLVVLHRHWAINNFHHRETKSNNKKNCESLAALFYLA